VIKPFHKSGIVISRLACEFPGLSFELQDDSDDDVLLLSRFVIEPIPIEVPAH
jgi:hypothetical protein